MLNPGCPEGITVQRKTFCIEQAFGLDRTGAKGVDRCMAGRVFCF